MLLTADPAQVQQLGWLSQTEVRWGCLALYTNDRSDTPGSLVVVGTYSSLGANMAPLERYYSAAAFPPFPASERSICRAIPTTR
jgi:hypothetical protein